MIVKELVKKLSEFDADLPVCLADWNERWAVPTELEEHEISLTTEKCLVSTEDKTGYEGKRITCVKLGLDD